MQKTAYEMRISDWSSDVCSSDLAVFDRHLHIVENHLRGGRGVPAELALLGAEADAGPILFDDQARNTLWPRIAGAHHRHIDVVDPGARDELLGAVDDIMIAFELGAGLERRGVGTRAGRSEEHTSELQSLMRISYAVFCLKKKQL